MKAIKLFAALCCALVCAFTFSSCDKQTNEPQTPEQPEQPEQPAVKPVAVLLDYTFEVTDEMREVADFNISYYDKDGKLQTEQLTNNTWNKVVTAALPAKLGVQVYLALKADFDPAKYEVFTALKSYKYTAYCLDAEGKKWGLGQKGVKSGSTLMAGDKIEAFVTKYSNKAFLQTLYTIDEEGNFTYHTEWE